MNPEMRSMLIGGGVVLLLVGALAGLWSMGVSPSPPALSQARAEETLAKAKVDVHMHEFISHYRRAVTATTQGDPVRAMAHLTVMDEFAQELENGRLRHKIPPDELAGLRKSVLATRTAVGSNVPEAAQMVTDLKERCVNCHTLQNGPPEEKLFGPLAPTFLQ